MRCSSWRSGMPPPLSPPREGEGDARRATSGISSPLQESHAGAGCSKGRLMPSTGALVLFSGGQDSSVCLAWALARHARVETVGFDYGQRHRAELEARGRLRERMQAMRADWTSGLGEDHVISLGALGALSDTALTRDVAIAMGESGLPTTFVPGRNLIFFAFAGALAYRRALKHLVGGMCETDYPGYPDCRDDTIKAMQRALNLGMERRFVLHTPLMWVGKAETFDLAHGLGGEG